MPKNTDPTKFSGQPLANAGKSIIELVWDQMDAVYARLMSGETEKGDKGQARGLAIALAILTNPYANDVDAIRMQAHARWEDAQPDEEEEVAS